VIPTRDDTGKLLWAVAYSFVFFGVGTHIYKKRGPDHSGTAAFWQIIGLAALVLYLARTLISGAWLYSGVAGILLGVEARLLHRCWGKRKNEQGTE
jgi:hypothetical protein